MRRTTTAVALTAGALSLSALAGCSDGSSSPGASGTPTPASTSAASSPSASPAASPSGSSSPAASGTAGPAVTAAVSALRRRNTGGYQLGAVIGSTGVAEQGTYRLRPVAYDVLRTIQPLTDGKATPGQGIVIRLRSTGGQTWLRQVRSGSEGAWPCWVRATAALAPITGVGADGPEVPPAVAALLGARGTSTDGAALDGSVDLTAAVAVLGSGAVSGFGLTPGSGARLPATFVLRGGRFVGWSEDVAGVPDAMTAAGLTVPSAAASLKGHTLPVRVGLATPKQAVRFTAPAAKKVVTVVGSTDQALNQALRGCSRR